MDETERLAIEREVQEHLTKVEALLEKIREIEEQLAATDDPPKILALELRVLKTELRGRMAAIAIGEGRLGVSPV